MTAAPSSESATETAPETGKFVCPECGKTFARVQGLGAHRRAAHGVAGSSATTARRRARSTPGTQAAAAPARTRSRPAAPTATTSPPTSTTRRRTTTRPRGGHTTSPASRQAVDRDGLLRLLYPNGIPARDDAIRALSNWLDEAERLARLR